MNHTTNYQLSQWESTDRILMSDFNSDNDTIDAALKAHDDDIAALETAVAGPGNCQIYTTIYTGNGQYGVSHPNSFTFPHKPLVVFVGGSRYQLVMLRGSPYTIGLQDGSALSTSRVTWTDKGVSWYNSSSGYGNGPQCNENGQTYQLTALLEVEP